MAFHLSHIHDYERFLAVDIGSYRIRTGAYSIESLDPVLLGHAAIRQNRKNMIGGSITDMRGVSLSIERSIIQASQNLEDIPNDVVLGFSSSQFVSDYITTQYVRKTASAITMDEVDTMVKKVEKSSFDRVRARARDIFGIIHDDLKLVSSTITSIEIDGKPVSNPIGFTGGKVRLSILNIFAPASDFNILRSISSHIGKNIISLIPTPLVFPKILEKTDAIDTSAYIIDIGLLHTTMISIENNSITALETFPFGSQMLIDLLSHVHPELTYLQREHMLSNDDYHEVRSGEVHEFLEYILDTFAAYLSEHSGNHAVSPHTVFVHGGILESDGIYDIFQELLHSKCLPKVSIQRFSDLLDCDADEVVTRGLAEIATELLLVKKDPLVRILRYVLYNYE